MHKYFGNIQDFLLPILLMVHQFRYKKIEKIRFACSYLYKLHTFSLIANA